YEVRLPEEARWEYACRAGRDTRFTFDGTRTAEVCTSEYCNYCGNYEDEGQAKGEFRKCTVPVNGSIPATWSGAFQISPVKAPNIWGFYQMHGNVWEWCIDSYDAGAVVRVLRGGGWRDDASGCRSAARSWLPPVVRGHSGGFRLAAVPVEVESGRQDRSVG